MFDIHTTVRAMFRAVYPIMAEARDFVGFAGRDLAEARYDARHSIPLVCLNVMEEQISSESLLPESTRTGFRTTVEMLRHRIDPRPEAPPQKWPDLWLRLFDYDIMELALPYLAQWSPPLSPGEEHNQSRIRVSSEEIRRREDLVTEWQRLQREEVESGRLAWKGLRGDHKPWTIDWLCEQYEDGDGVRIDRGDFGRWQRGELPSHSVKSLRIEAALTVVKAS